MPLLVLHFPQTKLIPKKTNRKVFYIIKIHWNQVKQKGHFYFKITVKYDMP